MSKIKIEKDKLSNFLKLISLANDIENKEALIDVDETGIKCLAVSGDKSLGLRATLKHPFTKLGQVGLDQLPTIKKVVNSIDKDFDIEFSKNKFIVRIAKTTVWFPLKNAEYILNKLDEDKFSNRLKETEKGISFTLSKEAVAEIVKKFNLVGSSALVLKVKDGVLTIKVKNYTNEVELETEIDLEKSKKNFNVKIGKNFVDLISLIGEEVTVSLAEDTPSALAVEYSGKDFLYTYLVALVDNKEEAPKETVKREKVNA